MIAVKEHWVYQGDEFGARLKWLALTPLPPHEPIWIDAERLFPTADDARTFAASLPEDKNKHFTLHSRDPR